MTATASERELLCAGARELGVEMDAAAADRLLRFVDRIYLWNRSAGLTTIPRADAVRLHLLDSLAASPAVANGPCADLGTGAGLPGVVLAIVRPDIEVCLVESNRKKVSFLHETVRELGVGNVQILEQDANRVSRKFPTVISRAFRQPPEFVALACRLAMPDGRVVLLLADPTDEELRSLAPSNAVMTCRRIVLPGGTEKRAIVSLDLPG